MPRFTLRSAAFRTARDHPVLRRRLGQRWRRLVRLGLRAPPNLGQYGPIIGPECTWRPDAWGRITHFK
jgi:hypothetical protein